MYTLSITVILEYAVTVVAMVTRCLFFSTEHMYRHLSVWGKSCAAPEQDVIFFFSFRSAELCNAQPKISDIQLRRLYSIV